MDQVNSREELEHLASEAVKEAEKAEEEKKEVYVERPKSHRILAWVLFALVIVGLFFYYFWIFKGGKL